MSKLLKAVKIVSKGFPAKYKQIVALSPNSLQYHNSESSLSVCLLPDHSRSLAEWTSVTEFELSNEFDGRETEDKAIPEGYLPISSEEWQSVVWTSQATDTESTRYALGGVCFTGNTVVATDGRRMQWSSLESDFGGAELRQIVPMVAVSAIAELIKLFKEKTIYVCFERDSIRVVGSCWLYTSRLVEGRFPNWQQVIPSKGEYRKDILDCAPIRAECEATIKRVKLENKVNYAKITDKTERKAWVDDIPTIRIDGVLLDCRYVLDGIGKLNFVERWMHDRLPANHPIQFESGSRNSLVVSMKDERKK